MKFQVFCFLLYAIVKFGSVNYGYFDLNKNEVKNQKHKLQKKNMSLY